MDGVDTSQRTSGERTRWFQLGLVCAANFVVWAGFGAILPLLPLFPPTRVPGWGVVAAVVALAVLSTSLAFLVYFRLIREVGPQRTLTVTYLIPVFAIAWGAIWLDEPLTLNMLGGGLLILLGVALANRRTAGPLGVVQTDKA
jgi:drug/metabolite transporter (DMT)-like permease